MVGTGWSALLWLNSSQTEEGLRRRYGSKGSDCVGRRPIQHSLQLEINGFRQRIDLATSWMSKRSVWQCIIITECMAMYFSVQIWHLAYFFCTTAHLASYSIPKEKLFTIDRA